MRLFATAHCGNMEVVNVLLASEANAAAPHDASPPHTTGCLMAV
jgi:hypothetical protein